MNSIEKKTREMSEILKLQNQVAEMAENNKKKVAVLEAKFEKIQTEAFDECPVCYSDISVKNTCCMPNCKHKMCKNCYYSWLDEQEKNTCPMCREEIFKTNLDIKTKRTQLQLHLDSLESEVADMYHERRTIRRSLHLETSELDNCEYEVIRMHKKFDQLENEIWDKQQIVDEINEYKRHPDKWLKKKKRREIKDITKGKKIWRNNMKKLIPEIMDEYRLKCIIDEQKGGYICAYYREELKRLDENLYGKKIYNGCHPVSDAQKNTNPIDFSQINIFDEPEDFAGFETRTECGLEPRVGYNTGMSFFSDDDTDTDTDEDLDDIPELLNASDNEDNEFAPDNVAEEGEIFEPPHIRRTRLQQLHMSWIRGTDLTPSSIVRRLFEDEEDRSTGGVTTRGDSFNVRFGNGLVQLNEDRSTGGVTTRDDHSPDLVIVDINQENPIAVEVRNPRNYTLQE